MQHFIDQFLEQCILIMPGADALAAGVTFSKISDDIDQRTGVVHARSIQKLTDTPRA